MRRPHAGETEDDLLAQMRQFEEESKKKSSSQQSTTNSTSPTSSNLKRPHSDENYLEPKPDSSRVLNAVVVERPGVTTVGSSISQIKPPVATAFPPVMSRDTRLDNSTGGDRRKGKRVSLFARQMAASQSKAEDESAESCCPMPERPVRPVKMKRKWSNKSAMLHSSEVSDAKDELEDMDVSLNIQTRRKWVFNFNLYQYIKKY